MFPLCLIHLVGPRNKRYSQSDITLAGKKLGCTERTNQSDHRPRQEGLGDK